jgi:hypothetical protein
MKDRTLRKSTVIVILFVFVLTLAVFGSALSSTAPLAVNAGEKIDQAPEVILWAGDRTVLPVGPGARGVAQRFSEEYLLTAPQTANIVVVYSGTNWTPAAQAAFQYAVDIWETLITSTVQIDVVAEYEPLGAGILGSAGSNGSRRNFTGGVPNTWYPLALANKLAGSDLDLGVHDINANFSSTFNWYLGTDGNPAFNQYDFVTVVMHELAHGLGFAGSMTTLSPPCNPGTGCWGFGSTSPYIYDRFTETGAGTELVAGFTNNSVPLKNALISDDIFFDGPNTNAANGGTRAELYAPDPWNQGSSYSHLGEVYNGTPNALMTYSLNFAEVQHDPGPVTLGLFADIGWTTAGPPPTPVYDEFVYLPTTRNGVSVLPQPLDPGFENGTPNGFWTEYSDNFLTPICSTGVCGFGGGTGPHSGIYWVWFGGTSDLEMGYVHQDVMFPNVPSNLTFWLEIPAVGTTGNMQVVIDGNPIFTVTEADAGMYPTYTKVIVDISAYSDGGLHNLRFASTTNAGAAPLNFFVDDVAFEPQ